MTENKTVNTPPSLEDLRRLVRGELSREDRIKVDGWLVRYAGEQVVNVLDNLIQEWNEEKADAVLPAPLRALSSRIQKLWKSGLAVFDSVLPEVSPMPALLAPEEPPEGLLLRRTSDPDVVTMTISLHADVRRVILVSTNDLGDVVPLHDALHDGQKTIIKPDSEGYRIRWKEGRVRFWLYLLLSDDEVQPPPEGDVALFVRWMDDLQRHSVRISATSITSPESLSD